MAPFQFKAFVLGSPESLPPDKITGIDLFFPML